MLQFLRLHARKDNFAQTVAKVRRFAETQEAVKLKKSVRIVEALDKDQYNRANPIFTLCWRGFNK